eukprot:12128266-Heterocapsa_arctica.AAC.1
MDRSAGGRTGASTMATRSEEPRSIESWAANGSKFVEHTVPKKRGKGMYTAIPKPMKHKTNYTGSHKTLVMLGQLLDLDS